ncbi:MAG: hypothetical protein PF961_04460 [Planctomycetota bacterium]|jgi:hypothetical protein|nr:hypothetical protein [Planctomycetota bacterium]
MRPLLFIITMLTLVACTPQEHLNELDPAMRQEVDTALRSCYAELDLSDDQLPPERETRWQVELMAQAARNAAPALAQIRAGTMSDEQLRSLGTAIITMLKQRDGDDTEAPLILQHLLDPKTDLSPAKRVLLLGAINRVVTENFLNISPEQTQLLGKPERQTRPGG